MAVDTKAAKKSVRSLLRTIFLEKYFAEKLFYSVLKRQFVSTDSVLELGAGRSSYIRNLDKDVSITAVDLHDASMEDAKKAGVYNEYVKADALRIDRVFKQASFDVVAAFDLIEHFEKGEGEELIRVMEKTARRRIIIFTPNGFMPQPAFDGNPFQEHKSGWGFEEMKAKGFRVYGINGLKCLTGMYALPRIRPRELGIFVRNISWVLLNLLGLQRTSSAILCVKDIQGDA